jgi:DNA-binding Lrp family transcriptional regulator
MKEAELKLIAELLKNSRRSDRDLAKNIGISQPTVTRIRTKLEKEGYIKEYTIIPDFAKLGYELLAMTFIKFSRMYTPDEVQKTKKSLSEILANGPLEIISIDRGRGLGCQGVFISLHRNYSSYMRLEEWIRQTISSDISDIQSFLVCLNDHVHYRYFTFNTVAKHLLTSEEETSQNSNRRKRNRQTPQS